MVSSRITETYGWNVNKSNLKIFKTVAHYKFAELSDHNVSIQYC
jgi:hypothetical protein